MSSVDTGKHDASPMSAAGSRQPQNLAGALFGDCEAAFTLAPTTCSR